MYQVARNFFEIFNVFFFCTGTVVLLQMQDTDLVPYQVCVVYPSKYLTAINNITYQTLFTVY